MDEAHKLATERSIPFLVALLAVAVRLLLSADRWTLVGVVRAYVVCGFVGWMAGMWIFGVNSLDFYLFKIEQISDGTKYVFIGLCTALGEDIATAVFSFGRKLRQDPAAAIFGIIDAVRGRRP